MLRPCEFYYFTIVLLFLLILDETKIPQSLHDRNENTLRLYIAGNTDEKPLYALKDIALRFYFEFVSRFSMFGLPCRHRRTPNFP